MTFGIYSAHVKFGVNIVFLVDDKSEDRLIVRLAECKEYGTSTVCTCASSYNLSVVEEGLGKEKARLALGGVINQAFLGTVSGAK